MNFLTIGITGPAGCGKDTAADHIIAENAQYKKMSFAGPMKHMLSAGLGLSDDWLHGHLKDSVHPVYGCSPRHMLQTLGTEWGRDLIGPDVWVTAMCDFLSKQGGLYVIPDVRFENEAAFVRKHGRLIHIRGRDGNIEAGADHVSESGVKVGSGDLIVRNIAGLSLFKMSMDEALNIIRCYGLTDG